MNADKPHLKDRRTYSVYGLFVAGQRFTDDFDQDEAVRQYVELHPDADPVSVRAELDAEIARRDH
ncbi:hypothetical protein [Bordetella bronchiseptica]|uniref:hypothetical protein n=1 Tax=Bordetella bronchiseptica TaxID=518 RepID=UPI003EDBB544